MKRTKLLALSSATLAVGALTLGATAGSVIGNAKADTYYKAVVNRDTTFKCSDGCSLPGVLNVDPQGVAGPDATDPTLRVGRWPRTIYIDCIFDASGDGLFYRTLVDDREWTGHWWVHKADLKSPPPNEMNDKQIPSCPGMP